MVRTDLFNNRTGIKIVDERDYHSTCFTGRQAVAKQREVLIRALQRRPPLVFKIIIDRVARRQPVNNIWSTGSPPRNACLFSSVDTSGACWRRWRRLHVPWWCAVWKPNRHLRLPVRDIYIYTIATVAGGMAENICYRSSTYIHTHTCWLKVALLCLWRASEGFSLSAAFNEVVLIFGLMARLRCLYLVPIWANVSLRHTECISI